MSALDIKLLEAEATADDLYVTAGSVSPADLPVDSDDDLRVQEPLKPTIDTSVKELAEREVEYDIRGRGPDDVVLSGPVIGGWGPGRYFRNRKLALEHYRAVHGADRVLMTDGFTRGRWSVLVKGLKK